MATNEYDVIVVGGFATGMEMGIRYMRGEAGGDRKDSAER
jgi:thioredoxin reductase